MNRNILSVLIAVLAFGVLFAASAQTPEAAIKPVYHSGDVSSVGPDKIVITTTAGPFEAAISDKTAFKKLAPGSLSFTTAAAAAAGDISVGDKATISSLLASDGKTRNARTIYFVTKADQQAKAKADLEKWRTRGLTGRVAAVNAEAGEVIVEMPGLAGASRVTLRPAANARFLKYAPDSIRYDEAKPSTIAEVKPGDMIRALGDRSADGMAFSAEEIVTGAFQTIAGKIRSVDREKGEIVIENLQTKKDVTVVVSGASMMKIFPVEMAERMAGAQSGGVRPGGGRPDRQGGQTAAAGEAGQSTVRPGGGGRRAAGGIDDLLERLPDVTIAELKAGDMIATSSTRNGSADRVKAIKLVAGVEPFLRAAPAGGSQRNGRGVDAGFSIPGLDGSGF